jgi:hypothetical protein
MPAFRAPIAAAFLCLSIASGATARADTFAFRIIRSAGVEAGGCLPNARGIGTVSPNGATDNLSVSVSGLPARTTFDVFQIQVPDAPFGIAWYLGRLQTNANGSGVSSFIGRFSRESFAVAPGSAPAPVVYPDDANANPAFSPVQVYHFGLWFHDPASAANAGCASSVTPFNGGHHAGIQALSTRNFPDDFGPLRHVR